MATDFQSRQRLLRPEELLVLSREIQAMISAGVPLDLGIRNAAGGFSADLEQAAQRVATRLEQGASISEAFRDEPAIPPVFRAILVAGLSCGQSEAVLQDVYNFTTMQVSLRQSLKVGLVYPITVIFVAVILMGVVASSLLPQMAASYEQLFTDLPKWLSITTSIKIEPFYFVCIVIIFVLTLASLLRTGRTSPLNGLTWLPGVSSVASDFTVAQFSRLLSLLVSYGIPLPEALRLAGEASATGRFQQETFDVANSVEQGQDLEAIVNRRSMFPPFLKWLFISGQHDSDLGTALRHAADFYQGRARTRAIWLSQAIPTVAVVVIGGSVTMLYALSVFLPMVELWSKMAEY